MTHRRALLIINPIAGTSNKKDLDRYVKARLADAWDIDVEYTKCHGDASRLARIGAEQGYDAVFAAGGDGTVNEAASALCNTDVPLGIIPCGSGNGLARHLYIPVDIKEGLKVIEKNNVIPIDYGTLNDDLKFFCTCGVGFDAAVSETFAKKGSRGLITYLRSALEEFHHYKPAEYSIRVGDQTITERAFLVAVCNASQYGNNAYIAPDASIDDGLFDITIVHAGNPLQTAFVGFDLMVGNINKNTLISHFQIPSTEITLSENGPVHLDGEPMHVEPIMKLQCHQHGLRVFAPKAKHRFVPFVTPVYAFMRDMKISCRHLVGIR